MSFEEGSFGVLKIGESIDSCLILITLWSCRTKFAMPKIMEGCKTSGIVFPTLKKSLLGLPTQACPMCGMVLFLEMIFSTIV
jgi:hypothetical protein